METITYEIAGVGYSQRPLCNFQQALVEEMVFDVMQGGGLSIEDAPSFFRALGVSRGKLMALCLIPSDMEIRSFVEKLSQPGFIEKQTEFFDWHATPADRYKVIYDFFACNQIGSCIDSLTNLMVWANEKIAMPGISEDAPRVNDSKNSVPSSQEGTLATVGASTP